MYGGGSPGCSRSTGLLLPVSRDTFRILFDSHCHTNWSFWEFAEIVGSEAFTFKLLTRTARSSAAVFRKDQFCTLYSSLLTKRENKMWDKESFDFVITK